MFPNPVQSLLTIQLDKSNLSLSIVDMLGKTVLSRDNMSNKNTINLSQLNNGVYFVSVKENGVVLKTEKLIVKN